MKNDILKGSRKAILAFLASPNFDSTLGQSWYINANKDLQNMLTDGLENRLTIADLSLICSILSPANRWVQNLKDTKNLVDWYFNGLMEAEKPKFSTYGSNVVKAINYLSTRALFRFENQHLDLYQINQRFTNYWVSSNMKALKTFNFYVHLKNPFYSNANGEFFTIDRHMLKIAGIDSKSITPLQYKRLQSIYFEVFQSTELRCTFHEFQAILWANYVFSHTGILHY